MDGGLDVVKERKGKSEPLFLVYRNGVLKDSVHGCNVPMLWRSMKENTPLSASADDVAENP